MSEKPSNTSNRNNTDNKNNDEQNISKNKSNNPKKLTSKQTAIAVAGIIAIIIIIAIIVTSIFSCSATKQNANDAQNANSSNATASSTNNSTNSTNANNTSNSNTTNSTSSNTANSKKNSSSKGEGTLTDDEDTNSAEDEATRQVDFPKAYFEGMSNEETVAGLFEIGCTNIKARQPGGYTTTMTESKYNKLLSKVRDDIEDALDEDIAKELSCSTLTAGTHDDNFENVTLTSTGTAVSEAEKVAASKIAKAVCTYQKLADSLQQCTVTIKSTNGKDIFNASYPATWRTSGNAADAEIVESIQ